MREQKALTEVEVETLKRLVDEYGLKDLGKHMNLSTRAIQHAIDKGTEGIRADHHKVVSEYLNASCQNSACP